MAFFRITLILKILFCIAWAAGAQKPAEIKKNGDRAFENSRWSEARNLLSQYQDLKPGDPTVLMRLGISNFHLHQGDKAKQYLEYVAHKFPDLKNPDLHFYRARTLHGLADYEPAIAAYKSFLRAASDKNPLRAFAAENIRRCARATTIGQNESVALVENMGDRVNTSGDEFAPLGSINFSTRVFYAAARENTAGGRRNDEGLESEESGHWCSDIFIAEQTTSGWETGKDLSGLINTPRFEVALGFSNEGKVLHYFRGFTLYSGEIFADTAGKKDEYAVNPPRLSSPMQSEFGDCHPCFFNDTTLLFCSRRAGGFGGLDIWITTLSASGWSEPANLGPIVNSQYDEITPYLAKDGRTIYFSSNHIGSIGGFDIFKSVFEDATLSWQKPSNLGLPVNSPADDAWFSLTADGSAAYLASDRLDSYGARDLYTVYFKDIQREMTVQGAPPTFYQVILRNASMANQEKIKIPRLKSIIYENDDDILNDDNRLILDDMAKAAQFVPEATAMITVHTSETGQLKFDLYYGIKRAEIAAKALIERGISPSRIYLRSVGPNYPIAKTVLNAQPNIQGEKLNRRIDVQFSNISGKLSTDIALERPEVSRLMASDGIGPFDAAMKGLSYKIEIATTRQILNQEALMMFDDIVIESKASSGAYQYTAGLCRKYEAAVKLRKDLMAQGFADATIIAYLHGIRISKADAVSFVKNYPDLAAFVKG